MSVGRVAVTHLSVVDCVDSAVVTIHTLAKVRLQVVVGFGAVDGGEEAL